MIEIFEKVKVKTCHNDRSAKGSIFDLEKDYCFAYIMQAYTNKLNIILFDKDPVFNKDGELVKTIDGDKVIQGIVEGKYTYDFLRSREETKINGEKKEYIKLCLETLKEKYKDANNGN